jgi:hypothetical protein
MYKCPWCNGMVEIIELNCKIFRHGYYKKENVQIPQHLDKESCDELFEKELIYGCGKPFTILDGEIQKCEYL